MSHTKLFIIAGAIAVAIVGIIFFDNRAAQAPTEQNNVEVDETSDWKTYRDVERGYEFSYPTFLIFSEVKDDRVIFQKDGTSGFVMEVMSRTNSMNLDLESWILKEWYEDSKSISLAASPLTGISEGKGEEIRTTIGGHPGIVLVSYPLGSQFTAFVTPKAVTSKESRVLVVKFWGQDLYQDELLESNRDEIFGILSTFKLIDETVDTSIWKTYRNGEYHGFELKHPENLQVSSCGDIANLIIYFAIDVSPLPCETEAVRDFMITIQAGTSAKREIGYYDELGSHEDDYQKSDYAVAGTLATQISYTIANDPEIGFMSVGTKRRFLILDSRGLTFTISFFEKPGDNTFPVFYKILSTLKLIE